MTSSENQMCLKEKKKIEEIPAESSNNLPAESSNN